MTTFVVLGVLFLHRYATEGFHYPVGYDASFYLWRAKLVSVDGLGGIGTIRAASPLLVAVLGRVTGQNAYALVAWIPALLAGVAALGVGVMVRAALVTRPWWIPVVGFLSWAAFGRNGMLSLHLDNLLTISLVLCAYAAATVRVNEVKGAVAATLMFTAAGLAHWTFYVLAMAIFVVALALFGWKVIWNWLTERSESLGPVAPLLGAVGISAVFVGFTFLSLPPDGWLGVRPLRTYNLTGRFLRRLHELFRYFALPPAVAGALVISQSPRSGPHPDGRRFFAWLMTVWVILSIALGLAQIAGYQTAGNRLVTIFFPATILTGVFVWWLAGRARALVSGAGGKAVATLVALGSVLGFGWLSWTLDTATPEISTEVVTETSAVAVYASRYAGDKPLVFVFGPHRPGHRWTVIRSVLPSEQLSRAYSYPGSVADYLRLSSEGRLVIDGQTIGAPIGFVLPRYAKLDILEELSLAPDHEIAAGVFLLNGPLPSAPVTQQVLQGASTSPLMIGAVCLSIVALLFLAGAGWARALLPADTVTRVALAPALGMASIVLVALGWDRVGLTFSGWAGIGPFVGAALVGWAVALLNRSWTIRRSARQAPQ